MSEFKKVIPEVILSEKYSINMGILSTVAKL
jgi:hypothetical protein